MHQTMKWKRTT